jgi:hypothetical protein
MGPDLPIDYFGQLLENYRSRGRCYDHNFLRFSAKNGVFLKNQCYDQILSQFSFVSSQKRQFFADFFG